MKEDDLAKLVERRGWKSPEHDRYYLMALDLAREAAARAAAERTHGIAVILEKAGFARAAKLVEGLT